MFSVGERIFYPVNGLGVVESIDKHRVLGKNMLYYHLKLDSSRMSAFIPVETAKEIGIRYPISAEEGKRLLEYLRAGEIKNEPEQSDNWNHRHRENSVRLKSGDVFIEADVFMYLNERDKAKGLSPMEGRMLGIARRLLREELLESGCDAGEVEAIIG